MLSQTALGFQDKIHTHIQPHKRIHTHSKLFLRRDAVFKPDVLETQHQCGEATISGQEAAILVQSVSAALGRHVSQWSQWPSDGTGVPLKWLTDWWSQQRSRESGRLSEYCFYSRSLQMWVCVFWRVFYGLVIYSQPFSGRWWYNAHYNSLFCAVIQTQFVCLTFIYL